MLKKQHTTKMSRGVIVSQSSTHSFIQMQKHRRYLKYGFQVNVGSKIHQRIIVE